MKNFLILIDGPKGAGKSTLSKLLRKSLTHTKFFSIDEERKLIKKSGDRDADNKKAFVSIVEKLATVFEHKENAVVDSAVFDDRLAMLEDVSDRYGVNLYKFSLTASPETLYTRVKEREEAKGRKFDSERFYHTLKVVQNKSLKDFNVLDSDKLSEQEIFDSVFSKIV